MYLVFSLIAPGTQVPGSGGSENIVIRIDTEVAQENCEEVISNIKVSEDENKSKYFSVQLVNILLKIPPNKI